MATKRKASHPTNVDGRPVKKSKSTTAGRGAEGENSATANGRTDNSQNVSHNHMLNNFVFSDLLPRNLVKSTICKRFASAQG